MFKHFGQRLERDIKQMVDRRLDAYVVSSGANVKVTLFSERCVMRIDSHNSQSSGLDVSVISHKRQRFVIFPCDKALAVPYTLPDTLFGSVAPSWLHW